MDSSNNNKFRHKKNGFLLVIDSMRFDTLNNLKKSNFLFPNLSNYFLKSQSTDCIANSNSTQFVMPALFTQSYPLDYGGYETGIRSRPKTFIEVFKENKQLSVQFIKSQTAVTPGQSIVFYDNDIVLGGGVIDTKSD